MSRHDMRLGRRPLSVLGSAIVALVVSTGLAASAEARSCESFRAGSVDYFSSVKASGVSCSRARTVLLRTTLAKNRRGAKVWSYAGWGWRLRGINEMAARVTGQSGAKRIQAVWSKT